MTQFVCYGGKGGVGKTTLAASTGVAAARRGAETLVISTDPAHSLADAFAVESGPERQQVDENLWIEELSPDAGEAAYRDRKSTRLNSSHRSLSRMPSSA